MPPTRAAGRFASWRGRRDSPVGGRPRGQAEVLNKANLTKYSQKRRGKQRTQWMRGPAGQLAPASPTYA
jgi:hypothetical protein